MSVEVAVLYQTADVLVKVAKLAVEWQKVEELSKLNNSLIKLESVLEAYTKLINEDVQTLMHMYFKSAYDNLKYAINAEGDNFEHYLREATSKFIEATNVEKNENLVLSYVGLSLCQALLDDKANSSISFEKIRGVTYKVGTEKEEFRRCKPLWSLLWDYFWPIKGAALHNLFTVFDSDQRRITENRKRSITDKRKSNPDYDLLCSIMEEVIPTGITFSAVEQEKFSLVIQKYNERKFNKFKEQFLEAFS